MNIFLVRHAQSEANVNYKELHSKTNIGIALTTDGLIQAHQTGKFLSNKIDTQQSLKVWNSPYKRTRQTSEIIKSYFAPNSFIEEESIHLAERQFGLVDDVADYAKEFHHESRHYHLHRNSKHEFFARPPLGESPFDMCQRLDFFLRCVLDKDIDNHIIVSHGAAIKGLLMMSQKWKYEQYEMTNPYNASVHLIEDNLYKGEIFKPKNVTT